MNNAIFTEAISLNNKGTHYYLNRCYDEAINCFRLALKNMQSKLRQGKHHHHGVSSSSSSDDDACSNDLVESNTSLELRFLDQDSEKSRRSRRDSPSTSSDNDSSFIFDSVIFISKLNDREFNVSPGRSLSIVAIVAMHNLAITTHVCGLEKDSKVLLERAVKYYELAYKLQSQRVASFGPIPVLSILNNIGTIYRMMNDQTKSNKFFTQLLSAMACYRESEDYNSSTTEQAIITGFWSNVVMSLMLKNPQTACAA